MRISELLTEAATAPLYHGTTFANALEIVKDGGFMALTSIGMDRKPYYGISTTRSPRLSHLDHDPSEKAWQKDTIEGFNVIFVLDQNKIRQLYKVIPFDFFRGNKNASWFNPEVNKLRDARSESEEFVVMGRSNSGKHKKLPINGNVTKIIYFPNSFKNPEEDEPDTDTFLMFKKLALRHNIPVVLNNSLFGYSDNERPWNKELRQSMITHPEKHEVSVDPKGWEAREILKLVKKYEAIGGDKMSTEQLADAFDKGEQATVWLFWLQMNARPPSIPTAPVSNKTFAAVFNAIKNADPMTNKIYKKIFPFRLVGSPTTPEEKKSEALKSKKSGK